MSDHEQDEEVGYGRPPKRFRFKKGRSGNPNGRPPKSKNAVAMLCAELDRKIPIQEGGRTRSLTKREVMIMRLVNGALKGNPRQIEFVFRCLAQLGPSDVPEVTSMDNSELRRALERYVSARKNSGSGD